ncbi:MAG: hypothetical protein DWQ05_04075 [Calditrichaeota bacterium]|nr:MAG: hypothetical protein DWQ05_04075 [Calditrichota bacterium]
MEFNTVLLIAGLAILLLGLIGRIKVKDIELGAESLSIRLIVGLLGLAFVSAALVNAKYDIFAKPESKVAKLKNELKVINQKNDSLTLQIDSLQQVILKFEKQLVANKDGIISDPDNLGQVLKLRTEEIDSLANEILRVQQKNKELEKRVGNLQRKNIRLKSLDKSALQPQIDSSFSDRSVERTLSFEADKEIKILITDTGTLLNGIRFFHINGSRRWPDKYQYGKNSLKEFTINVSGTSVDIDPLDITGINIISIVIKKGEFYSGKNMPEGVVLKVRTSRNVYIGKVPIHSLYLYILLPTSFDVSKLDQYFKPGIGYDTYDIKYKEITGFPVLRIPLNRLESVEFSQ